MQETILHSRFKLFKLGENGRELVLEKESQVWGEFLRYKYATLDFSSIQEARYIPGKLWRQAFSRFSDCR